MLLLTFVVAVTVNFVGYIPFGNINLTAVQISVNRGIKQAVYFVTAFAVADIICTYILMRFAQWFAKHESWLHYLDWILIGVFCILGYLSWNAATQPQEEVNYRRRDSIKYGVILGIFNPMQIPFWMIGGTYLLANNWITAKGLGLEVFSIGAGLGAFLCLYLFARFAAFIQNRFALSSRIINRSIAIIFFSLAVIHIGKQVWIGLR